MEFLVQLAPLFLLILVMYFLLIRPQKKREKATNEMRANVQVGDEIVTIGGICGKVVKTKDDTLVIQVGADKVKFEIMRWAVSRVVSSDVKNSARKEKAVTEEEEAPKKVMPKRMKKADTAEEAPAEVEEQAEAAPVNAEETPSEAPAETKAE